MKVIVIIALVFFSFESYCQIQNFICPDSNIYIKVQTDTSIICSCYNNIDKKNGLEITYSLDSIKMYETYYDNGNKHGIEKKFYLSGNLHKLTTYENGKKHGRFEIWYDIVKNTFQNGEQVGAGFYNNDLFEGLLVARTAMSGGVLYVTKMYNNEEIIIGKYINWKKKKFDLKKIEKKFNLVYSQY